MKLAEICIINFSQDMLQEVAVSCERLLSSNGLLWSLLAILFVGAGDLVQCSHPSVLHPYMEESIYPSIVAALFSKMALAGEEIAMVDMGFASLSGPSMAAVRGGGGGG